MASLKPGTAGRHRTAGAPGIPRLYAAASLKRDRPIGERRKRRLYSAALCRGLIEAALPPGASERRWGSIPRLYAAASLKQTGVSDLIHHLHRIPRLYAAASLKHPVRRRARMSHRMYSAALCRGLIEARCAPHIGCSCRRIPRLYAAASLKRPNVAPRGPHRHRIPRLYAAASLKRRHLRSKCVPAPLVFRGSMPRPH